MTRTTKDLCVDILKLLDQLEEIIEQHGEINISPNTQIPKIKVRFNEFLGEYVVENDLK